MKKESELEWDVRFKVWFEFKGQPIIGDGRLAMLDAIHRNGSIIEAARELGISYRKIRGALSDMEREIGQPVVKAYRGGGNGGGAVLTPVAHQLTELYKKIRDNLQNEISSSRLEAEVMLKSLLSKNLHPIGRNCLSDKKGVTPNEIF